MCKGSSLVSSTEFISLYKARGSLGSRKQKRNNKRKYKISNKLLMCFNCYLIYVNLIKQADESVCKSSINFEISLIEHILYSNALMFLWGKNKRRHSKGMQLEFSERQ